MSRVTASRQSSFPSRWTSSSTTTDGSSAVGQGRPELREEGVDDLGPGGAGGQVPEQDGRVVVAPVDRQPPERPRVVPGPLGQESRLPVARRGEDGGHRGAAGGFEEVEETGPWNLGVGSEVWLELRL